jgi:hypothetical protein
MSRKKISTTIYVTPEQSDRLKLLHERTKVPVAVYIREGIDLVLRHYGHLLPGQLPLEGSAGGRTERIERSAPRHDARDTSEPEDERTSSPAPAGSALGGHSAHAASKK